MHLPDLSVHQLLENWKANDQRQLREAWRSLPDGLAAQFSFVWETAPADWPAVDLSLLPGPWGEALLTVAAEAGNLAAVQATAESGGQSPLQKKARRWLHHFRSRGMKIARAPRLRLAAPAVAPDSDQQHAALLSPLDSAGDRVAWLAPARARWFGAVQAIFGGVAGLRVYKVIQISRMDYRQILKAALADPKATFAAYRTGEVARELLSAAAINRAAGRAVPEGFVLDEAYLRKVAASAGPPDWLGRLETGPEPPPVPEGNPAVLKEVGNWLAPADVMDEVEIKLNEVVQSRLYINFAQRLEQLSAVLERATERFFTPEIRRRYANWLAVTADLLERRKRGADAAVCLATARALADVRLALLRIPFAAQFIRRSFPPVEEMAALADPEAARHAGINPPARAASEPAQAPGSRIIIPK